VDQGTGAQDPAAAGAGCPKRMIMGPCGGVRPDGGCEARPGPCVFDRPALWADPVAPVPLRAVPLILTDFTADPYSVPMLASVAAVLAPACDAVLVGEHHNRPDFPPVLHAALLREAGLRATVGRSPGRDSPAHPLAGFPPRSYSAGRH